MKAVPSIKMMPRDTFIIPKAGIQVQLLVPDGISVQSRPILYQGLATAALPIMGIGSFHHNVVAPIIGSAVTPLGGVFQQFLRCEQLF